MRSALKVLPFLVLAAVAGFNLGQGGHNAKGVGAIAFTPVAEAASPALNACGCYRDSAGACYCGKKGGKCVCPGECEPQGCEEKRAKEIQKEVDAEAKRAREAEKKQADEQKAKAEQERKAAEPADDDGDDDDTADTSKKAGESASAGKDDDDSGKKKGKGKKTAKVKHGKTERVDAADKEG